MIYISFSQTEKLPNFLVYVYLRVVLMSTQVVEYETMSHIICREGLVDKFILQN